MLAVAGVAFVRGLGGPAPLAAAPLDAVLDGLYSEFYWGQGLIDVADPPDRDIQDIALYFRVSATFP